VGNQVSFTDIGITISDMSHKTFILNNSFHSVERPFINRGANTIMQGNRSVAVTEQGTQTLTVPEAVED